MSSYVERVIDFLEKHQVNPEVPKHLQEDIKWAIDVISSNKLYAGGFAGFKLSEDRPEVKAWTDLIYLKNIPVSRKEIERLKQFEHIEGQKDKKGQKKAMQKKLSQPKPDPKDKAKDKPDKADPTKTLLEKSKVQLSEGD